MKYQQIPITRLSRAGNRLLHDGEWHPFADDASLHYRVRGKIVQRVRLEAGETDAVLSHFKNFAPLPSKVLREGFREELCFRIEDDAYALSDNFTRGFIGWNQLAHVAEKQGVRTLAAEGNLLSYSVRIEEWTPEDILRSLVLAKAYALIAARISDDAKQGIQHSDRDVAGLFAAAVEVLCEDVGLRQPEIPEKKAPTESPAKPGAAPQMSLFGE